MSSITRLSEFNPKLIKFSKSSYTYGPSGRIMYTDYNGPRRSLNMVFGPCECPFGVSSYDNDPTKLSVSINIPEDHVVMESMAKLDDEMRETLSPYPAWAGVANFKPAADYIEKCYVPSCTPGIYGGQMRFAVRLCQDDPSKVRPLLLVKRWQDEDDKSKGYAVERLEYSSLDDLEELFPRRCQVHVMGRLVGAVFQRQSVKLKWEAVQIIKDTTVSSTPEREVDDLYSTIPDISFLDN